MTQKTEWEALKKKIMRTVRKTVREAKRHPERAVLNKAGKYFSVDVYYWAEPGRGNKFFSIAVEEYAGDEWQDWQCLYYRHTVLWKDRKKIYRDIAESL